MHTHRCSEPGLFPVSALRKCSYRQHFVVRTKGKGGRGPRGTALIHLEPGSAPRPCPVGASGLGNPCDPPHARPKAPPPHTALPTHFPENDVNAANRRCLLWKGCLLTCRLALTMTQTTL